MILMSHPQIIIQYYLTKLVPLKYKIRLTLISNLNLISINTINKIMTLKIILT
jgi:hypothetical protein